MSLGFGGCLHVMLRVVKYMHMNTPVCYSESKARNESRVRR